MGYTSSLFLLITLTAAFSNHSYCYLIVALGNLCEMTNPLSSLSKKDLSPTYYFLALGKTTWCFGILGPCTAARYPAVRNDDFCLC